MYSKSSSRSKKSKPSKISRQSPSTDQRQFRLISTKSSSPSILLNKSSIPKLLHHQQHYAFTNNIITIPKSNFAIKLSSIDSSIVSPPPTTTHTTPTTASTTTTASTATTTTPPKPSRPQLKSPLTITSTASQRVLDICASQDPPAKGIRLGVRTRGCSGLSYTMNFADGPASKLEEQVQIPNSDIKIFIDNKALLYVIGTTMDWTETEISSEFTFNNPNSTGSCGCGESFTTEI